MKLNLGCGTYKLDDYINIDIDKSVNPNIICNLGGDILPFKDNSVDYVYSKHFLEHLVQEETKHLLMELYRICKNKSLIDFIVPHYMNPVAYQLGHRQRISENYFDVFKKFFDVDYHVSLQRYRPKYKRLPLPFLMIIPCNIYFTLEVRK